MLLLLISAVAPSIALLYYFYIKDKYEKEPRQMLFKAFALGSLTVVPVVFFELRLNIFDLAEMDYLMATYTAFVVAGLVEEGFKFFIFWFFLWKNKNFNEMYDGIVYSVFISLGFATTENIGYVLLSGFHTAFIRSITAVPAHALFGVTMGYYFGKARFAEEKRRVRYLMLAFSVPIVLHGIYDFILFSRSMELMLLFIPYMLYLWKRGLGNVDELSERSPFAFRHKRENKK
ncbi:MAG TPA: PrsW family glutamic-type intramembrane protease [Patescibacteria group bacterium]|nr:PrsW family glutamic-type intramembrane protease [Patescibacteria group bacterium]